MDLNAALASGGLRLPAGSSGLIAGGGGPAPLTFAPKSTLSQVPVARSGGGGGGYGGGAAAPRIDTAAIAAYDQGIGNTQAAINRLDPQYNSSLSGIESSYKNALDQLLLGKNRGETSYKDNKQQTATDYVGAKNTIGANAGSSLKGLLRLLGSRGAGGSSAALTTAPEAVSRQATLQRGEVGGEFGKNNKALDINWNNFLTDYENQVKSAGSQREQQRRELQNQFDSQRQTLLNNLAQLAGQRASAAGGNSVAAAQPYLNQANAFADRAANFTVNPINYQTQAYTAPELNKYTVNPNAAPTYQGQAPTSDYFSPYLSALLGKKQQTVAA